MWYTLPSLILCPLPPTLSQSTLDIVDFLMLFVLLIVVVVVILLLLIVVVIV